MEYVLYQVDAFTDKVFGGNPACVVPLKEWLPDNMLLKIAQENAVAETAFFVEGPEAFHLRWFTPEYEVDLCGHATLATAHVLKQHMGFGKSEFVFNTKSGKLSVAIEDGFLTLNFPSRPPKPALLPRIIESGFNTQPLEVLKARDYFLVYPNEEAIRSLVADRAIIDQLDLEPGGIIATAPGDRVDFVSRFFIPKASVFEDPVTGSAHCSLIPFWSARLGKRSLAAKQLSVLS